MNKSDLQQVLVEEVSRDIYNVYLLDGMGEKIRRICGFPKKGVPEVLAKKNLTKDMVCAKAAGHGTATDMGFCSDHINKRLTVGAKNFYELAKFYVESSSLTQVLKDVEHTEINLNDISQEVKLLQAMQLQLMNYIEENEDDELKTSWTPTRIQWVTSIIKDIIRAKETASRIEGSMRLEMSTLRTVVEMIMSFLVKELMSKNVPKDAVMEIMQKMTSEVFIPMTNQALIGDKQNILQLRNIDNN